MEIKFKVDNEFYQQLYIDLPIVKVTVNCVCFEHNGNLTTVNFIEIGTYLYLIILIFQN